MTVQDEKGEIGIMLFELSQNNYFMTRDGKMIIERLKNMLQYARSSQELKILGELVKRLKESKNSPSKNNIMKYLNVINDIRMTFPRNL
jgi:hypothetical protein